MSNNNYRLAVNGSFGEAAEVKLVSDLTDILKTWRAIHLLRPKVLEKEYPGLISRICANGYEMAYIEEDGIAVSVIGYRPGILV